MNFKYTSSTRLVLTNLDKFRPFWTGFDQFELKLRPLSTSLDYFGQFKTDLERNATHKKNKCFGF